MSGNQRYHSERSRWEAVQQRDVAADGTFCYAVLTTGVYCRPGCASRLPRQENVRYFDSPEAAGEAGFRPCKRCHPQQQAASHRHLRMLIDSCRTLEQSPQRVSLSALASAAGVSPSHLQRTFSQALGLSPRQYQQHCQLDRFRQALAGGESVTDAIQQAGFSSTSRLYEQTSSGLGMTPGEYREGAPRQVIRHAAVPCYLGWVMVGLTARGVCSVAFGDEPQPLREVLQQRFPEAQLQPADARLLARVEAVVEQLEYPEPVHGLPLDITGSAFQQRVWRALAAIPPGERMSYGELAERIGHPRAARAVGSACAANYVGVLVPCHRAVRGNGDLSTYRWGVARKAQLLQREARQRPK